MDNQQDENEIENTIKIMLGSVLYDEDDPVDEMSTLNFNDQLTLNLNPSYKNYKKSFTTGSPKAR